ncbi:MAG: permease [Candidatus Firestonebacteria bacterium]|nr:permease [Candidatus Firestonebacteria bacterium]
MINFINKLIQIPIVMWNELLGMWWFVFIGISFGALIKTYKLDRKLYKILNQRELSMIFLATFIGIISPLCSCGILPVVITLIECGIPLSPVLALLITSPIMSPDALILTYGVLGDKLAFAKLFGAGFMGLSAGFTTYLLSRKDFFGKDVLKMHKLIDSCIVKASDMQNKSPGEIPINTDLALNKLDFFIQRAWELFRFMGKFILIASFIEAIIVIFIPIDVIIPMLGKDNIFSPVWATLLGIPFPVNGVSVVPILQGLIKKGMGTKASISFLISAPVTSIPAVIALNGMFKKQVVITFILICFIGSIFLGYLLG